jgi:hypothetical protein
MAARVNTTTGTADPAASSIAATAAIHTAGNLLVVPVGWEEGGSLIRVTDTAGNTYHLGTPQGSSEPLCRIAFCANCIGHATNIVTATFNGSVPEFRRIAVLQYSGMRIANGKILDAQAGNASLTPATNFLAGNLVTANFEDVLVVCGKGFASSTFTPAADWGEVLEVGGTFGIAERFVSEPGTYAAGQTFGASTSWAAAAMAFKAEASRRWIFGTH